MESAQAKYRQVFVRVLDIVEAKHTELSCRGMRLNDVGGYLNVGIGKTTWPTREKNGRRAFVIGSNLDDLTSEEQAEDNAPFAWFGSTRRRHET